MSLFNLRAGRPVRRCYTVKHPPPDNQQPSVDKSIASLATYLYSLPRLSSTQKGILTLVVDAYIRGNRFWPRSRRFAKLLSCSPPTLYRALKGLIPEWLTVERRPSKPAIYLPSQKLVRALYLSRWTGKGVHGS